MVIKNNYPMCFDKQLYMYSNVRIDKTIQYKNETMLSVLEFVFKKALFTLLRFRRFVFFFFNLLIVLKFTLPVAPSVPASWTLADCYGTRRPYLVPLHRTAIIPN